MNCVNCNKDPGSEVKVCDRCYNEALNIVACYSALTHFGLVFVCIFNFKFKEAFVSFFFFISRLTKTGPYAKGGKFDELKINWRKD